MGAHTKDCGQSKQDVSHDGSAFFHGMIDLQPSDKITTMTENEPEATEEEKERVMANASRLLFFLVTNEPNKIRLATLRRDKLRAAIARGEKPVDHRVEFITEASRSIFGWLGEKSQEFNDKYPFDVFTTDDVYDVLVNAAKVLKKQVQKEAVSEAPKSTSAS